MAFIALDSLHNTTVLTGLLGIDAEDPIGAASVWFRNRRHDTFCADVGRQTGGRASRAPSRLGVQQETCRSAPESEEGRPPKEIRQ